MIAAAFEWHNYGKSTIGNRADIERVPIESLRAFYRKYYQPDNIVLIIAGKFDEKKAIDFHGEILRSPETAEPRCWRKPTPRSRRRTASAMVMLRRVGKVPVVGVAYHVPGSSASRSRGPGCAEPAF